MKPLNERQLAVLLYLKKSKTLTAAQAGEHLLGSGLLKTRGSPSNYCLSGASVLQALKDRQLVTGYWSATLGRTVCSLTEKGAAIQ